MQSNTITSFARQQGQHIPIFKAIQMSSFNNSYFYICAIGFIITVSNTWTKVGASFMFYLIQFKYIFKKFMIQKASYLLSETVKYKFLT